MKGHDRILENMSHFLPIFLKCIASKWRKQVSIHHYKVPTLCEVQDIELYGSFLANTEPVMFYILVALLTSFLISLRFEPAQ